MTKNSETQPTVPLDPDQPPATGPTEVLDRGPASDAARSDDSRPDDARSDDARSDRYEPYRPPTAPTLAEAPSTDQPLGLISFVLALVGLWTGVLALPGLIVGVVGLRRRTADRAMAIAGVAISGGILAIGLLGVLGMTALIGLAGLAHLVD